MYVPSQIIHNLDTNRPMKARYGRSKKGRPYRTTHYIRNTAVGPHDTYEIALPATIEEARQLLRMSIIVPAPMPPTHHWRCGNWLSNHNAGRCLCAEIIKHRPILGVLNYE